MKLMKIRLDSNETVIIEGFASIRDQLNRMKHIFDDQRFIDVELKVSIHSSESNCYVIAHDLAANHAQ